MEKLLDLKEVKARCRVGYSTLYRWRKSGMFPEPVGIGKLLWREDQIIEWMNRQSTPVAPAFTATTHQRRKAKSFRERQDAADATLKQHNVGR